MSHYESRTTPEVLRGIERNLEDEDGNPTLDRIADSLEKIAELVEQITPSQQGNAFLIAISAHRPRHPQSPESQDPQDESSLELLSKIGLCLADPAEHGIREHSSRCILNVNHGGTEHQDNSGGRWLM